MALTDKLMRRDKGEAGSITVSLDTRLLRVARAIAASQDRSLSAFLTDLLASIVIERRPFERARRRAVARLRKGLDLHWAPPKFRQETHDR
jgi:hypothetical protein